MPLNSDPAAGIDLSQLRQLNADDYLVADGDDPSQLKTSKEPVAAHSFLCFSWGVSKQHRKIFNQLKAEVQRQYGVELGTRERDTGLITVGDVILQIKRAQASNKKEYQEYLKKIYDINVKHGDAFAKQQVQVASAALREAGAAGRAIGGAQRREVQNRLDIRKTALELEQRYGGGAGQRFLNGVKAKFNAGRRVARPEIDRWHARFSAEKVVMGLRNRIEAKLGATAAKAASAVLAERIQGLTSTTAKPPSELAEHAQIPEAWVDDAVDAALTAHVSELGKKPSSDNIEQAQSMKGEERTDIAPIDFEQAVTSAKELKDQQARITELQQRIGIAIADDEFPKSLFLPGTQGTDDIYRTCQDLADMDQNSVRTQVLKEYEDSAEIRDRLADMRHMARLGLQLQQSNVPPQEAEYILHMEATLRGIGEGNDNPRDFSPLIENTDDARQLAQQAIALETNNDLGLNKSDVGQLLELELEERFDQRGADNFHTLSPMTAELAHDRDGLTLLQKHRVPISVYGKYRANGARHSREVLECHKLGVNPAMLHVPKNSAVKKVLKQWAQAGFSEVETLAYQPHFKNPYALLDYRGSLLKPEQIQAYRQTNIPYTDVTNCSSFNDDDRIGGLNKLGNGAFNTVYLARYRAPEAPEAYQEVVFKPEQTESQKRVGLGNLGNNALRNCVASWLDKKLGFNVLVRTEVGIADDKPGIFMSRAKGELAAHLQIGKGRRQLVTEDSKYRALLQDPDLRNKPARIKQLCKAYRLAQIEFGADNQVFVRPAVLAQNKSDPDLQRELVKLQLMDALLGNRDRHGGNYFIDFDTASGKPKVAGVDNDDAYNDRVTDPWNPPKSKLVALPPVIDAEMAKSIKDIDESEYRDQLSRLSPSEIDAAMERLQKVKEHVAILEDEGRIIKPDGDLQWGSKEVTAMFTPENSYVGRDCSLK